MKRYDLYGTVKALLGLLLLNGCATLSQEACLEGDWFRIGYEDGFKGYQSSRIVDHVKACREYNIAPDKSDYQKGWDDGVTNYCTKENGYEIGEDVDTYRNVCPSHLEKEFLQGYLLGLDAAETEINQDISKKNREIIKATVILQELKDKKYKNQLEKIERLEREIEALEDDISDIYDLRKKYELRL
jgi:hypothetical protein